jgi:hypothetical protein
MAKLLGYTSWPNLMVQLRLNLVSNLMGKHNVKPNGYIKLNVMVKIWQIFW